MLPPHSMVTIKKRTVRYQPVHLNPAPGARTFLSAARLSARAALFLVSRAAFQRGCGQECPRSAPTGQMSHFLARHGVFDFFKSFSSCLTLLAGLAILSGCTPPGPRA